MFGKNMEKRLRANCFAQIFAILCSFGGGFLMMNARGNIEIFYAGLLVLVGGVVWYFKKGQRLMGWVGDELETIRAELATVDFVLSERKGPTGAPLSSKEWDNLHSRQSDLRLLIHQYQTEKSKPWHL